MLEGKSAFIALLIIVGIITIFIVKIRQSMVRYEEEEEEKRAVFGERQRTKEDYLIVDETGKTILMQAVIQGFREGVDHILGQASKKAINLATDDGTTALHYAVATGDPEIVAKLLSGGAKADPQDHDGRTPLWLASQRENCRIIELLLEYRADIDVRSGREQMTPLMASALYGRTEVVDVLLDNRADATPISIEGKTAADYGRENLARNMGSNVALNQQLTTMVLKLEAAEKGEPFIDAVAAPPEHGVHEDFAADDSFTVEE